MLEKIKPIKFTLISFSAGLLSLLIYMFKLNQSHTLRVAISNGFRVKYSFIFLIFPLISIIFYFLQKKEKKTIWKKINWFLVGTDIAIIGINIISNINSIFLKVGIFVLILVIGARIFSIFNDGKKSWEEYLDGEEKDETQDDEIKEYDYGPGDFVLGEFYKRNKNEDGVTPPGEDAYITSGKKAVIPIKDRMVHCLVLGVTGSGFYAI